MSQLRKTIYGFGLTLFSLAVFAALLRGEAPPGDRAVAGAVTREQLLEHVDALNRLLFQLAAERYRAHAQDKTPLILTVHHGKKLRKYTDGKFVIASIPWTDPPDHGWTDPPDHTVLCEYAEQYNSFYLSDTESKLKARDYEQLLELYRNLAHFAPCEGLYKETLQKRVSILEKLKNGEEIEGNLSEFMKLKTLYLQPYVDVPFGDIQNMTPTVVTNLLSVTLP